MKAILQRVHSASVTVDQNLISKIGKGILIFAAIGQHDTPKEVEKMASKVLKLKLWDDSEGGKWKRNIQDIKGEILCVSQFTLYARTDKGNKPSFHDSAGGDKAKELYDLFFKRLQQLYDEKKTFDGVFAAMMNVALQNDGPVTLELLAEPPKQPEALPNESSLPNHLRLNPGTIRTEGQY